jgi:Mrp family chromosome partitioning ATPase
MRHLQGRIKNKIRLKSTEAASRDEIPPAVSPVNEAGAPPSSDASAASRREPAKRESASEPGYPAIRIEKGSTSFTHGRAAAGHQAAELSFRIDTLMTAELFQRNQPVVLGVTSALPGEGKTAIAFHLAMSIARGDHKQVCLIDMSLGENTLSHWLGIATGTDTDLAALLEDTSPSRTTIETIGYERLSILPAGTTPKNAARAARSRAVPDVLKAARQAFDVVIVDMPSITSGNVSPIARHLDAMIVVVNAGVTAKETVASALERLDQSKVLALVLNHRNTGTPSQ